MALECGFDRGMPNGVRCFFISSVFCSFTIGILGKIATLLAGRSLGRAEAGVLLRHDLAAAPVQPHRPAAGGYGVRPPAAGRNYEFNHEAEDFALIRTNVAGRNTHMGTGVLHFGRDDGFNEHGLAVTMSSCGFPVGPIPYMRAPRATPTTT